MEKDLNVIFITYEEAQRLKPYFKAAKEQGPWREARESASRILEELSLVRPIDYSPFGGRQVLLGDKDYEFLLDVMDQVGLEER